MNRGDRMGITFFEYVEKQKQIPLYWWQRKAADALLAAIRDNHADQDAFFLMHQLTLFLDEHFRDFETEDDRRKNDDQ